MTRKRDDAEWIIRRFELDSPKLEALHGAVAKCLRADPESAKDIRETILAEEKKGWAFNPHVLVLSIAYGACVIGESQEIRSVHDLLKSREVRDAVAEALCRVIEKGEQA